MQRTTIKRPTWVEEMRLPSLLDGTGKPRLRGWPRVLLETLGNVPSSDAREPRLGVWSEYTLRFLGGESIRFLCSPFYEKACRWAMLDELKPQGPKRMGANPS